MGFINRIVAGSPSRKTRLHSESGNVIPLGRLLRNGSRTLVAGLVRVVTGIRPKRPWISYDAQAVIARHLKPGARVLEFGSGMSTAWYAARAGTVFSIEHDPAWFAAMKPSMPANVTYKLAETEQDYVTFPKQLFDLIMVDGIHRVACVKMALPCLAPSGLLYLDNSDRQGQYAEALAILLDYAERNDCEVLRFTDFVTAQLFVEEGMMLRRRE